MINLTRVRENPSLSGFDHLANNVTEHFDPRVWVREGEKTMSKRVTEALQDFNTANQL